MKTPLKIINYCLLLLPAACMGGVVNENPRECISNLSTQELALKKNTALNTKNLATPEFPFSLEASSAVKNSVNGAIACVALEFSISDENTIEDIVVLQSYPKKAFVKSAIYALKRSEFKEGLDKGIVVFNYELSK